MKENTMAKAVTQKRSKTTKPSKLKKASPPKSFRAAPAKPINATKTPVAKKAVTKTSTSAKKTRAARTPVVSKDELRTLIEKLTRANLALKTKGRESAKALKAAEARIAFLERQVNQSDAKPVIDDKLPE